MPLPPPRLGPVNIAPPALQVGETLHCQAEIKDGFTPENYRVNLQISRDAFSPDSLEFALYDDGTHGDEVAGDNLYTLDLPWQPDYGTNVTLRARIMLDVIPDSGFWKDTDRYSAAVTLSVFPPEEMPAGTE